MINCKLHFQKDTLEIPYYELEATCKMLCEKYLNSNEISKKEQLERQKFFLEFSKGYETFTPYFDFVICKLGYLLENPFLISNTILSFKEENGVIYYYAIPKNGVTLKKQELRELSKPLFIDKKEKNIRREKLDLNFHNIKECFLDEEGWMVFLECTEELHNFWAKLWIHDFISKEKKVCKDYEKKLKKEGIIVYNQAALLILYKHWVQLSQIFVQGVPKASCRYRSDLLNEIQANILMTLKEKGLLLPLFDLDLNEEQKERRI